MALKNHLIIGLGGTGGKIMKAFRKRIYETFRSDIPVDKDGEKNVNLGYLWVDSDEKDLNDTLSWKVLGHGVHLGLNDRLHITGVDAGIVDNIYNYPHIEPWLGDPKAFKDVLKGTIGSVVGGQRRRLGRLLFAYNAGKFCNSVRSHVATLFGSSNSDSITFHICAGLAGGTGSGSIIDAIALCRSMYPNSKIVAYVQIPDRNPETGFDTTGNYHANGYAALAELNAISVGGYMPFDVSGEKRDTSGQVVRLLDEHTEAFNVCWVFGNEIERINGEGKVMDVTHELPVAVSDFLFQKVVATEQVSDGQLKRVIDAENGNGTPEMDDADEPVRGKRFASFGIKRVEYPETEIREFVTYSFAKQVALQLKYNTFVEGIGYTEKPEKEIGMNFQEEVSKNGNKLKISDDYITLSEKLEDNSVTKNWVRIDDIWTKILEHYFKETQKAPKKEWLSLLRSECDLQYNKNYRSNVGEGGVVQFYKNQRQELSGYASLIRRNIEGIVFSEWRSGDKSFIEVEKYIGSIIEYLEKRDEVYEKQINERNTKLNQKIIPDIKNNLEEWKTIFGISGTISDLFGKSQRIFIEYKNNLREFYLNKTWIEAYSFAQDLRKALINELYKLQDEVKRVKATVDSAINGFNEEIGAKCKENEQVDVNDMVVKMYNAAEVRKTTRHFEIDKKRQKENASAVRTAMVKIGEDLEANTFAALNKYDSDSFLDLFVGTCATSARDAMSSITSETSKMLSVNILEKLKYEYGREEKLERFVKDLISSAGNFVRYNDREMNSAGSGKKMSALTLVLPQYEADPGYRDKFIETFASNVDSGVFSFSPKDVVTNYKDNQIVIISASSVFPLRYVDNLTMLRERFESRLIGPQADMNRLVLFTEGDGSKLPPLFAESMEIKKAKLVPVVLLLFAMGLVVDEEDVETGLMEKAVPQMNGRLRAPSIILGKNVLAAWNYLATHGAQAAKIKAMVDEKYRSDYKHITKKEELMDALAKLANEEIFKLCGGNQKDADYVQFVKSVEALFGELEKQ